MPRLSPLAVLALAACGPKDARSLADVAKKLDYGETPQLLAPDSGSYARAEEDPQDPVLKPLLRGKHVEAALQAAAGGLALAAADHVGGLARWELRESLWRAGWPYPADEARAWSFGSGHAPSADLIAWVEAIPEDQPLGLVRARGAEEDVWVGIRAVPAIDLGPVPRVTGLGSPLVLPPVPGATWRLSDQEGTLREGTLDAGLSVVLAGAGEWLFEIRRDGAELARFPVYVAISPPTTPLLRLPDTRPITGVEDVDALAVDVLGHVREAYGRTPWKRSTVFDAAVGRYVGDPSIGSAGALRTVGFSGASAIVWACDDATVESCVDAWVWDPRRRAVLLTDRMDSYGLHASLDARGVHLTLLLVDAE
jgi:hypothetical protein